MPFGAHRVHARRQRNYCLFQVVAEGLLELVKRGLSSVSEGVRE